MLTSIKFKHVEAHKNSKPNNMHVSFTFLIETLRWSLIWSVKTK